MPNLNGNGAAPLERLQEAAPFDVKDPFENEEGDGAGWAIYLGLSAVASSIPPYWSPSRDMKLVELARKSDPVKIAVNTFISKALTIPLRFQALDPTIQTHVDLAGWLQKAIESNSEMKKGFQETFKKFLFDYLTCDNGAFAMILGFGPVTGPIVGRALGLLHLSSKRCIRTSNPEYPVVYLHTDNKRYKIHYTRILSMVNLSAPEPELHGVGMCPVSLCLDATRELNDISLFSQEKFGSRPQRQILYVKQGMQIEQIRTAMGRTEQSLDSESLSRFSKTLFLAPKSAGGKLELDKIDLASIPDGFNRQEVTILNMAIIAASFGLDLPDLALAVGLAGQTRSVAETQHHKGLGKGVAEFIHTFSKLLTERFLPSYLEARFDYVDDRQDEQAAKIVAQRSTARTRDIMGGVLTPRIARRHMVQHGELTEVEFEELELSDGRLPDGTSVLSLFSSTDPVYTELLSFSDVEDPTDVRNEENDVPGVLADIHINLQLCWIRLETERDIDKRRKIRYAVVALQHLEKLYVERQEQEAFEEQQAAAQAMGTAGTGKFPRREGKGDPSKSPNIVAGNATSRVANPAAPRKQATKETHEKAVNIIPDGAGAPIPEVPDEVQVEGKEVDRAVDWFDANFHNGRAS